MKQCLCLIILCWSCSIYSQQTFQTGKTANVLLELFTSEGCSSCPPAEKWINNHVKTSEKLWKQIIPVVFHVDYWDYLGWPDKLAEKLYSKRQYAYASYWKSRSVYTPGFVVNGSEWRAWRQGQLPNAENEVGVLQAEFNDNQVQVQFTPLISSENWKFHVALLGCNIRSHVTRGENQGETLLHNFAVLKHITGDLQKSNDPKTFVGTLKIKPQNSVTSKMALAIWVTKSGGLIPVQATGGYLR